MVFSSSVFLVYFLPLFILLYHLTPGKYRNYTLLLASIIFYSWGAPRFLFLLLGSTVINFVLVSRIHKSSQRFYRRLFLTSSVIVNIGLLAYFKYANFFVENMNFLLQQLGAGEVHFTKVILPIGISFFTFQSLTYSMDVYRKVHDPLNKLSDYMLYILSFPQMIAGPIVRFNSIADEIISRKESMDDKLSGFYRFCIGLAKKALIANAMGAQADLILNGDLSTIGTANAWIGILAYTFQIYFDFSAYSDMAIGLGKIMGFHFPENFDSPYTSQSITEFWRRWHITLGRFMRDYLYIPLGGNRVTTNRRLYFNLATVFVLSGLWHGASWNFVLWGAFHGLFLILDRIFLLKVLQRSGRLFATLFTFFVSVMGWVVFRIENVNDIGLFYQALFNFTEGTQLSLLPGSFITFGIALFFAFNNSFAWGRKWAYKVFQTPVFSMRTHYIYTLSAVLLFLFSLSFINSSSFNPFIYFRF